ncbi:MAG: 3-isopropylmalate dehydratase small subunit [Candidatus Aphodousia sp.]|nr:3-isopropylmalate dehydratase small subunit [Sutterella sp.]MDY2899395.1 3-isopropylmalate dehydratase small subunit [Candidatus Aphodousia sp.]
MEKFSTLTAVAAPLPIDNLDTDQLMPKQFLRGIDKSGLAKGLLYHLRFDENGQARPNFVLNKPGFEQTRFIVSGPNFGCGSSREHAVWGLLQYGIRAVIATGFGEIFYSNCFNNGLLAAKVSPEDAQQLLNCLSDSKPQMLTIDVASQSITTCEFTCCFDIASRHKTMLLEGLDMLGATMKDFSLIEDFAQKHRQTFSWMSDLAGKRFD